MDEIEFYRNTYTSSSVFEYKPVSVVNGFPQFGKVHNTEIMLEPTTNNLNDDSTKTSTS
jgi:hypothetical protein